MRSALRNDDRDEGLTGGVGVADPMAMRKAVAGYVEGIHRAYVKQATTFPPAVQGRLPLLAAGRLTVAAVGARNLHILATTEGLGPAARAGGRAARRVRGPRVDGPVLRPGGRAGAGADRRVRGAGVGEGPRRAGDRDRRLPRRHPARLRSLAAPRGPRRLGARERPLRGDARLRAAARPGPRARGAGRRDGGRRRRGARPRADPAGPRHPSRTTRPSARPSTPPCARGRRPTRTACARCC